MKVQKAIVTYWVYDPQTFYLIDVRGMDENTMPVNSTLIDPADFGAIVKPKFDINSQTWSEEATQEEVDAYIAEKQDFYMNELLMLVNQFDERILISSVNKYEKNIQYLGNQIKRYESKYNEAKYYIANSGSVLNQAWRDQIEKELSNINAINNLTIDLPTFMGQIVFLYEEGAEKMDIFQTSLEIYRTKTKDLIFSNQFDRANECIQLGYTIPETLDMNTDLPLLMNQLDSI